MTYSTKQIQITYPPSTGYVPIDDLHEVLEMYYEGTLDNIEDLSNLYKPLYELIPGKPLISQLLSSDIKEALTKLSFELECIIEAYHLHDYKDTGYASALIILSEIVYRML